ncbi:sulfurtransferase, partial [Tsukamurella tyrosinosolvens]
MIEPFVDAAWVRANPGVILADTRCYLDGRSTREAYD